MITPYFQKQKTLLTEHGESQFVLIRKLLPYWLVFIFKNYNIITNFLPSLQTVLCKPLVLLQINRLFFFKHYDIYLHIYIYL